MFKQTGIISNEELLKVFPSAERRLHGPYAVFECFQEIPCNPCSTSCSRNAVQPMEDINDIPVIDYEKCNGCGMCVSHCPGLACFVIDETYGPNTALIKIPYELSPLPAEGSVVKALDRSGTAVGQCKVVRVQNNAALDRTSIISIEVPKELIYDVRSIKVGGEN